MKINSKKSSSHRLRSGRLIIDQELDKTNRTRAEVWMDESESVHSHHLVVECADSDSVGDVVEVKGWPEYAQPEHLCGHAVSLFAVWPVKGWPEYAQPEHRFARSGGGAPEKAVTEVEKRTQAFVIPPRDDQSRGSGESPELPKKGGPKWPN